MRIIDANALMEIIRAHDYPLKAHYNSTDNGMFTNGIQQAVDECPTIEPAQDERAADECGYCTEAMNILQRICDKITRHKACKLTEVVAAVTPEIYVYKCLLCGYVFWGNKRRRKL